MDTQKRSFEVNSFLFGSHDSEVALNGRIIEGHMSFQTELSVTHSQLNLLINELKKQNNELKIEDHLEAQKMYNDEILYTAIFSNKIDRIIDLNALSISCPNKGKVIHIEMFLCRANDVLICVHMHISLQYYIIL